MSLPHASPDGKHQLFSHRLFEDMPEHLLETLVTKYCSPCMVSTSNSRLERILRYVGRHPTVEERKRDVHKRNIRPVTLNGLHKGSTVRDSSAQFTSRSSSFSIPSATSVWSSAMRTLGFMTALRARGEIEGDENLPLSPRDSEGPSLVTAVLDQKMIRPCPLGRRSAAGVAIDAEVIRN